MSVGYSWDGNVGNYTDPSEWSPEGVPGPGDSATITSGEVDADAQTISGLALLLGSDDFNNPAQLDLHGSTLGLGTTVAADGDATILGDFTNDGTIVASSADAHLVTVNDPPGTTTNSGLIDQEGGELGLGQGGGGLGDLVDTATGVIAATGGGNSGAGGTLLELGYDNVELDGSAAAIGPHSDLFITTSYSLTGTGVVTIGAGGDVDDLAEYTSGPTFKFGDGAGNELRLFAGNTFDSTIVDFQQGDNITLTFGTADMAKYADGVLTISDNGAVVQTISLASTTIDYNAMTFTATQNGLSAVITVAPTDATPAVTPSNVTPTSYTWDGSTGSFSDQARWTPNGVPSAGDTATITAGEVNADGMTLTGIGIMLGSGDVSASATLDLSSATIGAGTTITTNSSAGDGDSLLTGAFTNDGVIETLGTAAHMVAYPSPEGTTTVNNGLISSGGGELGLGEGGGSGDFDNTSLGVLSTTGGSFLELGYDNAILDGKIYAYGVGSVLSITTSYSVTGSGVIDIGAGGQVADIAEYTAGPTFRFDDGAGDILRLHSFVPTTFASGVEDFQQGDTIVLAFATANQASWQNGILTVSNDGQVVQTISLTSSTIDYSKMVFSAVADPNFSQTTDITVMPCFAAGSRIMTPNGEVAVEALQVGDQILTLSGEAKPVRWIGTRHVACNRHPQRKAVRPIRIAADAFGERLPSRDLLLSPDHAIFFEGVLIPVKHLQNGTSIRQLSVSEVTYFHVELDEHDVLLAEGLPVESYLDTGDRASFADQPNVALHPAWGSARCDVTMVMAALAYAPLQVTGPELDRAQVLLAARLGQARKVAA